MELKQAYEIYQAITLIREYIRILTALEAQQTDMADKLPYETMIEDLSMAIFKLESQYYGNNKKEKLATSVLSFSEIKKLPTNYLPGSICYVLPGNDLYILDDINHEWIKAE